MVCAAAGTEAADAEADDKAGGERPAASGVSVAMETAGTGSKPGRDALAGTAGLVMARQAASAAPDASALNAATSSLDDAAAKICCCCCSCCCCSC